MKRTALNRKSRLARTGRLKPMSAKRARASRVYAKKRREFMARFRWCQMCENVRPSDVHHSAGRIGALLNDETKWFALCRGCHDRIHANPKEARTKGWLA
jgi:hypothetical protein